jgi:hypothetical protein
MKKKAQKPAAPTTPARRVPTRQLRAQLATILSEAKPVVVTKGESHLSALIIPLGFDTWDGQQRAIILTRATTQAKQALAELA